MELEVVGDADGVVLGPEERTHDLLSGVVPSGVSNTVWIGVGEEDDFIVTQGKELGDLDFAEASGGKPDVLRITLGEDDGGFLGFDDADLGTLHTLRTGTPVQLKRHICASPHC